MLKLHSKKLALYLTTTLLILTAVVVSTNSNTKVQASESLLSKLSGKILLQVEDNGEAWYLNPEDNKRSFLGRPHDAFAIMREEGIGITNDNLSKIPLSLDNLSGKDSDSDGLPDNFEEAIGTNPKSSDTDSDGYDDYTEVKNNYSPRGDNAKRQTIDKAFAKSHQGKIFIQVEGNGEAWYVDTENNLRHYLGRPSDAFSIMRHLGLGITNTNLNQITIREGKGIQEYNYSEPKQEQQQGEENKEEYKNHITVTTHKPELMREFSNIINVSATINDSSGYDFKEKGFLFDYTMNKEEVLKPTLAKHKEKLIDTTPGLSIEAEIDNLLPKSYPYIRAYVITAEDIVYYGETEVLILGNTESIDSIGAPGTPPMFGGGGGGGSSTPAPKYYDLTYTAGDNGYLATTAPEVVEEPEWESETSMPEDIYATQGFADGDYIYYVNNIIEDGSSGGIESLSFSSTDFEVQAMSDTSTVYRYNTVDKSWDNMASMPITVSNPFETQAFYVDGFIYNINIGSSLNVYVYNISEDFWVSMETLNNSLLHLFPFGSIYNDKVYLVGINNDNGNYSLAEFNPETGTISDVTSSEFMIDSGEVRTVVLDNKFYIFEDLMSSTNVYSYNFLSDEWSNTMNYDSNMGNMGNLLNYNGNILNIGGYTVSELGPETHNDIYLYIPETNSWQKILTKPHSGFYGGASILNDKLYLGGGMIPEMEGIAPSNYQDSIDLSFINLSNKEVNKITIFEETIKEKESGSEVYAVANNGYQFDSWSDDNTSNPRTDNNVQSDINVSANFIGNDYNIIFNANGGTGTMANQTITFNTSDNLTANTFTREGYTFTGWATTTDGVVAYTDGSSFTMDVEGITLYAQWEMDCGDDVTFTYNGEQVTYGVVGNPDTGMCWLDRNLGATQVATALDDPLSYGDLFQWGRGDDGHQERTSSTTSTLSSSDDPGHSDFITNTHDPYDWRSSQNDNLWQGVEGVNNPCPSGFRLPTSAELTAEMDSWSSNDSSGAFNSPLKWSVAGGRHNYGSLVNVGSYGDIWSSSVSGSNSSSLYFGSSGAGIGYSFRADGNSVRCLRSNDNNSNDYDIIFNANGGTGTMSNQTITFNTSANLTTNSFTRANYTFTGWNTESNGSGTSYSDGASFTMNVVGITLYAQWEMDCGDDVTFIYNGKEVTYGVVGNPDTGMCWLDRNLGATQVATALDDPDSYGDLFQWGRGDDGHQERTSNTTSTLSSGDVPGHSDFITSNSSPNDWRSPQENNLWQGVEGVNNPCPSGFRLPTSAELEAEKDSWSSNNSSGAFNSPLKWAVAGYRGYYGSLNYVGSRGYIWSSSVSGSYSSLLYFSSSGVGVGSNRRATGHSVRCLRD